MLNMLSGMNIFDTQTPLQQLFAVLFIVWLFFWKGLALWRAAKNDHKYWFVGLLVINLLGIPEIIYVLYFSKKKSDKAPRTHNRGIFSSQPHRGRGLAPDAEISSHSSANLRRHYSTNGKKQKKVTGKAGSKKA
jgi:hypothetical protein